MTPISELVRAAIRFSEWAAGEGIAPVDQSIPAPENFLMDYSTATGDEEWETLAERISAQIDFREPSDGGA